VIHPDIRPQVEKVARILSSSELDVGVLHRIESDLLPDGYNGVVNAIINDGSIRFEKDMDT
jgi:hypothetical protein